MKNRQLFQRDPAVSKLLNDGVVAVTEAVTAQEVETLRYELEHFVCEGQYEDGLIRILESYLGNGDDHGESDAVAGERPQPPTERAKLLNDAPIEEK